MIKFHSFNLENGLNVYVHEDPHSKVAVLNIIYKIGSGDEEKNKTGLAHLFEHVMFGGSQHIPDYDTALQRVGGESNAYTTPDFTNYYCIVPAENLETAFWLEADRMLNLAFKPETLIVQKKVVIEEFKEYYLNQPYGNSLAELSKLAYKKHPYRWPVIGKNPTHISKITMDDIKLFKKKFYNPGNAILVIAGKVSLEQAKKDSQKWFSSIPSGYIYRRELAQEPLQKIPRTKVIHAEVSANAIFKAYRVPGRSTQAYYIVSLLNEALGSDNQSSRFYRALIQGKQYFSSLHSFLTESFEPGLLIIEGKLNDGIDIELADRAILETIEQLAVNFSEEELHKVKNQIESFFLFEAVDVVNRSQQLAVSAMLGNANLINYELKIIRSITLEAIKKMAKHIFKIAHSNTIFYKKV